MNEEQRNVPIKVYNCYIKIIIDIKNEGINNAEGGERVKRISNIWIVLAKAFAFLIIYSLFHFAYPILPLPVFAVSEAVWEHMKIGFFAILFLNLLEPFVLKYKGKIFSWVQWAFSRLVSTLLFAPIIFLIFYFQQVVFGKISPVILEVGINILNTFMAGFIAFYAENEILDFALQRKKGLFLLLIIFLLMTAFLFLVFTYTQPYYPLFTEVIK